MNPILMVLVVLFCVQVWFLIVGAIGQYKIRQIAQSTHIIVNSQRTMLLRLVAALSRRIADENPEDAKAQDAATIAEKDAETSNHPRRVSI